MRDWEDDYDWGKMRKKNCHREQREVGRRDVAQDSADYRARIGQRRLVVRGRQEKESCKSC